MSRLMSVAFTEQAVRERRKTVTRRKGWWEDKHGRRLLKPGDTLTLCRKVMGRKPGEPLIRICDVEVVSVTREPLCAIQGNTARATRELAAEGFPILMGEEPIHAAGIFLRRYFYEAQRMSAMDDVTRIEWRYLP